MAGATSPDLLVDTARAYLDERGLEGLTLREIARRAGVSHGAPLRHFPSLAALCSAVATQGFRQLYTDIAEAMEAAGPDGRDRLGASGQAYVRFAVANPGAYSLMFRPDRCDPTDPDLQAAEQAAFAQLLYAVAEAQGAGWRADVATADLAAVVWAGVHGVAGLTILGALDRSVTPAGGDADRVHLTALIQDLMGLTPSSTTPLGGEP
ncbi:MAG: TetR/AcrR family transcriptional regulator [Acidimicrobiales bacterium]